ncbi:MAG: ABC transporter permease [Alphaproteobacteria bacterium]|nr:ABC transporter permease [Alphaproteobacteria bacterium]
MNRDAQGVAAVGAMLILAGLWQPQDPHAVDLAAAHAAPSWSHLLGADHLGRDMLSRLMLGAGNTAIVLATIGALAYFLGTAIGVGAAICGGAVETVLLRSAEFLVIMPSLVLALAATALFGLSPLSAGLALGIAGAGPYALVAHGLATRLLAMPYVQAARALGAAPARIAGAHVLPNCAATMRAYLAGDAGRNVVHYAALAFLGLGADATSADWGAMLYEYRLFIFDRPELMLWPGLAITLTALALNLLIEPDARDAGRPTGGVAVARRAAARRRVTHR